jgi:ribosomal protein S18 acetylase RimI-like enzyme
MSRSKQTASLRAATPDDEAFLFTLFASTRDEFNFLEEVQKQALLKMQYDARRFQYDEGYPQAEASIILLDDCSAGRLLVNEGELEITLVDIALLPEYRCAGIGTQLVQDLLDHATIARKPVKLHVLKTNPALRLYGRLGFLQVSDQSMYVEMMWHGRLARKDGARFNCDED